MQKDRQTDSVPALSCRCMHTLAYLDCCISLSLPHDPAKNEEIYGVVPYQKVSCHVTYLCVKRKLQHVDHQWVTSELFCGSVDQMGHQVQPTFNPVLYRQL